MSLGLILKRTFAGAILLSVADCSATGGRYGGAMLDKAGYDEAANTYRGGGRLMNGFALFAIGGAKENAERFHEFGQKHGKPQP